MFIQDIIKVIGDQSVMFLIILTRFTATFSSLFVFRKETVPVRITLFFSLALSLFFLMYGMSGQLMPVISSGYVVSSLLTQLFLGVITAFVINLFFEVFLGMGQIISVQSGLGFVNLFIPRVGSVTPLSQFFLITALCIFFQINGHLILIKMIINSFHADFLLTTKLNISVFKEIIPFARIIIGGSLMLSLAGVITLLITNITIAIMTKFSPQLNIFSIGINISLILCFFMAYLCFDATIEDGTILLNDVLKFARGLLGKKGILSHS